MSDHFKKKQENLEVEKMSLRHVEIKKEEKIDIEDLVLPSEQTSTPNMENIEIKEEPMDTQFLLAHERKKQSVFSAIHHGNEDFVGEIERDIAKLFEQLDMIDMQRIPMFSLHEYDQMRVEKVKQLVEKYQRIDPKEQGNITVKTLEKNLKAKTTELNNLKQEFQSAKHVFDMKSNQMSGEINSLKVKVTVITKEHRSEISRNSKTMNNIVKMLEKALEGKNNELNNIKKELNVSKTANSEFSKRIQELELAGNQVSDKKPKRKFVSPKQIPWLHPSITSVHEGKKPFEISHTNTSITQAGHTLEDHIPVGHAPVGHAPTGHAPAGQAPTGHAQNLPFVGFEAETSGRKRGRPKQNNSHTNASITQAGQTLAGHAPADHAPADHAPAGHAPASHVPAGYAPTGHASAGHAQENHAQTLPSDGLQAETRVRKRGRPKQDNGPNKVLKCLYCDHKSDRRDDLAKHLATVHEGKKHYQCSQCDSAFKSNQGLRNHFAGKHIEVKPYSCKHCNQDYTRKDYMETHESKCHKSKKNQNCPG